MNKNKEPHLSVITVNFNNAAGLEKTIKSVIAQNSSDIEFIVIDGGSTDSSRNVIEKYSQQIQYSISEKDNGIYHAMNKGIKAASGKYCFFLNSGDVFFDSNTVDNAIILFDDADIVYGNVIKIKPHYRRLIKYSSTLTLYDFYKTEPALHHQGTFIKKDLFDKHGNYDEKIKINADWEFFFRTIILNKARTKYIDQTICVFDGTGLSNSLPIGNKLRFEANLNKENILRLHFPDYLLSDYKKLDKILSGKSFSKKIINKISYFRIRK